jgi:hypothetical protein
MDKVDILCNKDEAVLRDFSECCIGKLNGYVSFRLIRTPIHHFIDDNVLKEIRKDRIIIEYASSIFAAGQNVTAVELDTLFEKTKEVDKEFIGKIVLLPLSLDLRYEEIMVIRKERIGVMVQAVFDLLGHWRDRETFSAVVRKTYTEERFREMVLSILHLYNLETEMLGSCIKVPPPMAGAMDIFTKKLFPIMEETAHEIVHKEVDRVFGGAGMSCRDRT